MKRTYPILLLAALLTGAAILFNACNELPSSGIETTEAEITDSDTADAVTTDAATTDAVTTDAVTTDAATTDAATTDAVTTDAVTTDAVTTDAVTTDAVTAEAHTHAFGTWKTVTPSTCKTAGKEERTCACGATESRSLSLLPHTPVADKAIDPTCEENGKTEGSHCSACNTILTAQTLRPALGHTYENRICTQCSKAQMPSVGLSYEKNAQSTAYTVTGIGTCKDTELLIPDTYEGLPVTAIGKSAFKGNTAITSLTIGDSITSIGYSAFLGCSSLSRITLGSKIERIEGYAFARCSRLTSVSLPSALTTLESYAFTECTALGSVSLPASLSTVQVGVFDNCNAIKTVEISDLAAFLSISFRVYSSNPLSHGAILSLNGTPVSALTVPSGITRIGAYALIGCTSIESVTVPEGVTEIGASAFSKCTSLTAVSLPASLKALGEYAFYDCSRLSALALPSGLETVGTYALGGCASLKHLSIPETVKLIGEAAFSECAGLESITLPFIGRTPTSADCREALFGYVFGTDSYTGSTACTQTYADQKTEKFYLPTALKNVVITGGAIPYGAFSGCASVTSVSLPNGITHVGERAFLNCKGLSSIVLPSSVTHVGAYALYGCTGLTALTVSEGVTEIGESAFANCTSLREIRFNAISCKDLSAYGGAFAKSGKSGADVTFRVGASVTRIPAALFDIVDPANAARITHVVFESGSTCTEIGAYAFRNCTRLTSVTLSDSVKTVGKFAFSDCTALRTFTVPEGVTEIGAYAFGDCPDLAAVQFEAASGWTVSTSKKGTNPVAVTISSPESAAELLRMTYCGYYWFRTEE